MSSDWQVARGFRRKAGRVTNVSQPPTEFPLDLAREWLNDSITSVKEELPLPWMTHFNHLVCFGIGSPSNSHSSRLQLALALSSQIADITVIDPWMSETDLALLAENQCKPHRPTEGVCIAGRITPGPTSSQQWERPYQQPQTLVFMPHCEYAMFEAILRAGKDVVRRKEPAHEIWILGNDLSYFDDRGETCLKTPVQERLLSCRGLPPHLERAFCNLALYRVNPHDSHDE
ncbi:MAG: uncharacterized protein KVP18_001860 [Porospora cf. gigantea A]|uniref:uncharacterized protein n=1 Tax=Porospora cf. gigantea A TaxID=2853593 RepID=UPI0035596C68|nr:MAG: hypothetical protein KVP18_001860 [Porospora cf. gigantea A]